MKTKHNWLLILIIFLSIGSLFMTSGAMISGAGISAGLLAMAWAVLN